MREQQTRMRWLNPVILMVLVMMAACNDKPGQAAQEAAPPKVLPVTHVLVKDTNLFREYVADIQVVQNVELRARVQGVLERIYVDEGEVVKKKDNYSLRSMMKNTGRSSRRRTPILRAPSLRRKLLSSRLTV